MTRRDGPWIGQLGRRLTLAFVGVALAAVGVAFIIGALSVSVDVNDLLAQQKADVTEATAVAASVAYGHSGWGGARLSPVTDLVAKAGAAAQVTDMAGRVIHSSPGYAAYGAGPELRDPVVVRGRQVGWVSVKFDDKGLGAAIAKFQSERWHWRIAASGVAVLIALLVAVPLSRRISLPVDKVIKAARSMASGNIGARAGNVHGFGEVGELSVAFDHMADTLSQQDQLRRNLVADVAHELRTPIAVLQAGHEAMLDGITEPTSDHLASLRDEVLRLARMVDDLQRLASAEAAALQLSLVPCDLAAVAATAADSLADSFDAAGLHLVQRLADVRVICDPLRMHEVTVNLLTNAIKFTPAGGTVVLSTGPCGPVGLLQVSDTGIGIPADELPRVSERFFRGRRSYEVAGSGIGLTIVDELARAHRGNLDIASEPGIGTQVTISLPLLDGADPMPSLPA